MYKRSTILGTLALVLAVLGGTYLLPTGWRIEVKRVASTQESGQIIVIYEVEAYRGYSLVFKDRIRQVNFRGHGRKAIETDLLETVRTVTEDGAKPRVIEGPHGTVTTIFADGTDGHIQSFGTSVLAARNGSGTLQLNPYSTDFWVWGYFSNGTNSYYFQQPFIKFDTSSIPDTDTISSAVVQLDVATSYDDNGDLYQLRKTVDWGTLTTADYVPGATFSGLTLLSTVDYGAVQGSGYTDFSISSPDTNIEKTGTTYLVGGTDFFADGDTPPAQDGGWDWNATETADTTSDPKLVITHEAAGGPTISPISSSIPGPTGAIDPLRGQIP